MELKDRILAELSEDSFVSGEMLAKKYFVSRNSIWKAVNKLREEGYEIGTVTNKGYRLNGKLNKLSGSIIEKHLKHKLDIVILDEVDSTNSYAKELALSDKRINTAVLAEKQTGGRGRMGRPFFSPDKNGLYMSLLCYPQINAENAPLVTSFVATAAAKAVEKLYGCEVNIKWVNDIYLNGKKICGILTEAGFDFESGNVDYLVIGIGINVSGTEFPKELESIMTSLEKETGISVSRNLLAAEILNNLSCLDKRVKSREYLFYYREKSNIIGRKIHVICGNVEYDAEAVDIDDNAALIVRADNGFKTLNSGEVSIKI